MSGLSTEATSDLGIALRAYDALASRLEERDVTQTLSRHPAAREALRVLVSDAELMGRIAEELRHWKKTSRSEILGTLRAGLETLEHSFSTIAAQEDD